MNTDGPTDEQNNLQEQHQAEEASEIEDHFTVSEAAGHLKLPPHVIYGVLSTASPEELPFMTEPWRGRQVKLLPRSTVEKIPTYLASTKSKYKERREGPKVPVSLQAKREQTTGGEEQPKEDHGFQEEFFLRLIYVEQELGRLRDKKCERMLTELKTYLGESQAHLARLEQLIHSFENG